MLVAASLIGFGIATWATFLVDHLALFGLRPVLERQGWLAPRADTFVQPAVYRWVRHPMMTGVLLGIWAMPDVSAGRILLAVLVTAYVIVGTHFEERELLRRFGEPYAAYRARTGRFFPRPW
jgi:protein-S-isoprenylcysteine O-methyltransferase Ste14